MHNPVSNALCLHAASASSPYLSDVIPFVAPQLSTLDLYHLSRTSRTCHQILHHHNVWQHDWQKKLEQLAPHPKPRVPCAPWVDPPIAFKPSRPIQWYHPHRHACLWLEQCFQQVKLGRCQWAKPFTDQQCDWSAWFENQYPRQADELFRRYEEISREQDSRKQSQLSLMVLICATLSILLCWLSGQPFANSWKQSIWHPNSLSNMNQPPVPPWL